MALLIKKSKPQIGYTFMATPMREGLARPNECSVTGAATNSTFEFHYSVARPEDIKSARLEFEEDDEGMEWSDFLADYLDMLQETRASIAEGEPPRPAREVFVELES